MNSEFLEPDFYFTQMLSAHGVCGDYLLKFTWRSQHSCHICGTCVSLLPKVCSWSLCNLASLYQLSRKSSLAAMATRKIHFLISNRLSNQQQTTLNSAAFKKEILLSTPTPFPLCHGGILILSADT